jgi:D-arabinose 1-dehydrogenase-like Zn-dependent alcohol dehydrogenase
MGKTYKAVEITKPGTFRLVEKPVVGPGEEQVRIRVEACGVCHSDAGTVEGQLPGVVYPRVPGHEAIGRIEEVGRGVTTWKVGQRVGVGFFGGEDGTCETCRRGILPKPHYHWRDERWRLCGNDDRRGTRTGCHT